MSATIYPSDLTATRQRAREILTARHADIQDDTLDGQHWFIAINATASNIVRRERRWSSRRAA